MSAKHHTPLLFGPQTPAKRNGSAIVQMIRENKIAPTDPNVSEEDVEALSEQCEAIYARLKQGPATSKELAALSLKYTSRASDLRKYGIKVKCEKRADGVWVYSLEAKA